MAQPHRRRCGICHTRGQDLDLDFGRSRKHRFAAFARVLSHDAIEAGRGAPLRRHGRRPARAANHHLRLRPLEHFEGLAQGRYRRSRDGGPRGLRGGGHQRRGGRAADRLAPLHQAPASPVLGEMQRRRLPSARALSDATTTPHQRRRPTFSRPRSTRISARLSALRKPRVRSRAIFLPSRWRCCSSPSPAWWQALRSEPSPTRC
jgi:hypothetical protein